MKPERLALRIIDASCLACSRVIGKELTKMNGILKVNTNPVLNEVYVYYESGKVAPEEIEMVVKRTGYKAVRAYGMR